MDAEDTGDAGDAGMSGRRPTQVRKKGHPECWDWFWPAATSPQTTSKKLQLPLLAGVFFQGGFPRALKNHSFNSKPIPSNQGKRKDTVDGCEIHFAPPKNGMRRLPNANANQPNGFPWFSKWMAEPVDSKELPLRSPAKS